MDLFESIEQGRFVGREFLLWLWFESEALETALDTRGEGACELWLETGITLAAETEQCRLTGAMPSSQPEAAEALRQGKLPTKAGLRLVEDGLEYGFTLTADSLGLTSVRIPATLGRDDDAEFEERMDLVEKLDRLLGALYADFLALRLGPAWNMVVVPAIRAWMRRDGSLRAEVYERAKKGALARRRPGAPPGPNHAALARIPIPKAKSVEPPRADGRPPMAAPAKSAEPERAKKPRPAKARPREAANGPDPRRTRPRADASTPQASKARRPAAGKVAKSRQPS